MVIHTREPQQAHQVVAVVPDHQDRRRLVQHAAPGLVRETF